MPIAWLKFKDVDTWSTTMLYFIRKSTETSFGKGVIHLLASFEIGCNYKKAKKYLHKAAIDGHANAQWILGALFCKIGGTKNIESAKSWLKMAADRGKVETQWELGRLLYNENIEKNFESSKHYFQMASNQGDWKAQLILAQILRAEGKINEAQTYLKLAADQGYTSSQNNLRYPDQSRGNISKAKFEAIVKNEWVSMTK